jgi:hypothetical protein
MMMDLAPLRSVSCDWRTRSREAIARLLVDTFRLYAGALPTWELVCEAKAQSESSHGEVAIALMDTNEAWSLYRIGVIWAAVNTRDLTTLYLDSLTDVEDERALHLPGLHLLGSLPFPPRAWRNDR